jgi:hypothetical protein
MKELTVPAAQTRFFEIMASRLDHRQNDYCMSVFIDEKANTVTWVGGCAPNYSQLITKLEKGHGLKSAEFALPGDLINHSVKAIKDLARCNHQADLSPLVYKLSYENRCYTKATYTVDPSFKVKMQDPTYPLFRRFVNLPVHQSHVEYLQANTQRAFYPVPTADLNPILREMAVLLPFEFIQIDNDKNEMRIQRTEQVEERVLPDNMTLPISLVLNPESINTMSMLCTHTDTLSISMEGETITIANAEHTVTCSLAGVEDFYARQPERPDIELKFVVDFISFKEEIRDHCSYRAIKKKNECMLLIDNNELFIATIHDGDELARQIYVKELKSEQTLLYRFHLRDLTQTKIMDITTSHQMKLSITKNKQGDRQLEFYRDFSERLPYASIPVEADHASIKKVLALKKDYQKEKQQHNGPSNDDQTDLFGFGEE